MFSKNLNFQNFKKKKILLKVKKDLKDLLKENNQILRSLQSTYKNKYSFKKIIKIKNCKNCKIRTYVRCCRIA